MNKIVLITGATSGIGLACARKFAENGDRLILTGRKEQLLAAIRQELIARGAEVVTLTFDVRNREAAEQALNGLPREWKEIDFTKDQLIKPCRDWLRAEGTEPEETRTESKWHYEQRKVVKFFLKPDREKMSQRMCLSEHPFGTIKRAMGASYFLLRGIRKVAGEFALFCLGYNLERAKNLLGFQKMMELMEKG